MPRLVQRARAIAHSRFAGRHSPDGLSAPAHLTGARPPSKANRSRLPGDGTTLWEKPHLAASPEAEALWERNAKNSLRSVLWAQSTKLG